MRLYDKSQGESSLQTERNTQKNIETCNCCCDCENQDESEYEVKTNEFESTANESKSEIKENIVSKENNESKSENKIESSVEDIQQFKSSQKIETTETEEDKNYKIAYCCCGKNCHTTSTSLTNLKEIGPKAKYDINYVKPRKTRTLTRSASAMETSRSRSRSAKSRSPSANGKPIWIPTGANQYYNTHSARSNLMSQDKFYAHDSSTLPIQAQSSTSKIKNYQDKSVITSTNQQQPSYYTYQSYEPSKTVIKTTIDSKSFIKNNDGHYFNVISEKSLPKITQKSVNFDMKNNTEYNYQRPMSASYSYNTSKTYKPYYNEVKSINACNQPAKSINYYSVAPPTTFQPVKNNYQPVDSTFKGKIFSKNNEIHYVSNNANSTWSTNKTPHVRIVNAGTTVIHE